MRRHDEPKSQLTLEGGETYALTTRRRVKQNRYCYIHGTLLTPDEDRDSEIVGQLPRCRECLAKVGMPG